MKQFIFIALLFASLNTWACLNLTGKLSGSCVYSSKTYGDLEGSIDFDINQASCNEITIDGLNMKIPGNAQQRDVDGESVDQVDLAVSWKDAAQSELGFQYTRTVDMKGKRVDDIALTGSFKQQGKYVLLKQTGTVDHDAVEVICQLYK